MSRAKRQYSAGELPSSLQLSNELTRERYRRSYAMVLRSTIYTMITVAAIAILVAVLFLPVLRIYGSSMNPTLNEGDIVVSVKGSQFKTGEIIAFYYNNKILVKRVIANTGDWVDIDEDGYVYVNGEKLDEPYLQDRAFGETDIKLPYQVPDKRIFVMGDNRSVSVDSRNTSVGCVAEEQIVGKIVYCVWPFSNFGAIQ